jgi:hypothetical protein
MLVLSFVQLYCCAEPEKVIGVVESPAQTIWSGIGFTVGIGDTVIEKVSEIPIHPLNTGVTTKLEF